MYHGSLELLLVRLYLSLYLHPLRTGGCGIMHWGSNHNAALPVVRLVSSKSFAVCLPSPSHSSVSRTGLLSFKSQLYYDKLSTLCANPRHVSMNPTSALMKERSFQKKVLRLSQLQLIQNQQCSNWLPRCICIENTNPIPVTSEVSRPLR